jgi:hypothetical protein
MSAIFVYSILEKWSTKLRTSLDSTHFSATAELKRYDI